ncbi:hypothetical protein FDH96_gp111 [Mycobacterium phage Rey]|uniref:Uncharacterized protein n=1 Tax=Mycobacterium phage Rey TaxID=1034115 RepID=G1D5K8_9CAUD|nr:hypothetical protein FDH96_gp111 [Mycobacterium phage Rey]AEK10056.1 hypothetical protein PBI_REY_168 [Mycobacterium phage Rey]
MSALVNSDQHTEKGYLTMAEVTRHDDGSSSWPCGQCGATVQRFRGQGDVDCECGACYNAFGQRLRSDWRSNPSNYDDEIGDMEGYEISQLRAE